LNRTKIEYLDYTWNPLVGCSGVGCAVAKVCWAKGQAKRRKHDCDLCYRFVPHAHPERLEEPFHVKKPSRIGVCFMGDLYCQDQERIFEVLDVMRKTPQHTYVSLTKQARVMHSFGCIPLLTCFPENVWLGVSVNLKADLWRIEELKQTNHAGLKFVSFEPLYEDIAKPGYVGSVRVQGVDLQGIDWVIIGAQKRPELQPNREWVADLIMRARDAGAKVFLKNNLKCTAALAYLEQFGCLQEIPEVEE
jgi:protein gp37